jgi:hypothetical protein
MTRHNYGVCMRLRKVIGRKGLALCLKVGIWLVFGLGALAEMPSPEHPVINRLCGSLEHWTPIAGVGNISKPLRGVVLELYQRQKENSCCANSDLVAKVRTRRGGRYEVKNLASGEYWLVAHWKNEIYKLPITYVPREGYDADCELQGLDIDNDGKLRTWIQATM